MGNPDPYDLSRFVTAQAPVYETVCEELGRGCKNSHWMWFIFPQIAGLGFSAMSQKDAVYTAIRPMLAVSGGQLVLMSTPHGRRGHFYEAHKAGEFRTFTITAEQCPRITKEFLESERRALGDSFYRQEYFCEFLDTIDQVFRSEHIERAVSDEIAPLFGPSGENTLQPLFPEGV